MSTILEAPRTIQRLLVSTTSRLVGSYSGAELLVDHAWLSGNDALTRSRLAEGPSSRNAFVATFETEPIAPRAGVPIPNYSSYGGFICAIFAVFFGKRFDTHGAVQQNGMFFVPELRSFNEVCNPKLPHNSHSPRVDFAIPLVLNELARVEVFFDDSEIDPHVLRTFSTAAKFYLLALQNLERDAEVAYLHLITSVEVLSNFFKYPKEELLDADSKKALASIRSSGSDGPKLARKFEKQLLHVKRRFVRTVLDLMNSEFFDRTESAENYGALKESDFEQRIAAAYDLRSRYVHTGVPFGSWAAFAVGGRSAEVQIGKPVLEDKQFEKLVYRAPTAVGLERIVRFCLLRFLEANALYTGPQGEPSNA
jgi:Apea-like HEPN